MLHVKFIQDSFVMYNDKVLIHKQEVITHIPDYKIPVYFCQNKDHIIKY